MAVADDVAQVREQWQGVIDTLVAAGRGDAAAIEQFTPFLAELERKPDWRTLAGVLARILNGERDPLELLRGLDETDTLIAGDVLRGLGVDVPIAGDAEETDDGGMVTLEDFIAMVARAVQPDAPAGLAERLSAATLGMATQPNALPEVRELGRVLNRILAGDKTPELGSALPEQWARRVREMTKQ